MADDVFHQLEVIDCPKCSRRNLSWCFVCFYCGFDLFDEEDKKKQENQSYATTQL